MRRNQLKDIRIYCRSVAGRTLNPHRIRLKAIAGYARLSIEIGFGQGYQKGRVTGHSDACSLNMSTYPIRMCSYLSYRLSMRIPNGKWLENFSIGKSEKNRFRHQD